MSYSNSRDIDDALAQWGFANQGHTSMGRVGRVDGAYKSAPLKHIPTNGGKPGLTRGDLTRMVNKSPEVMVKISKSSKDVAGIKGYLNYLAKEDSQKLDLEDNDKSQLKDKKDRDELVDDWHSNTLGKPMNQTDGTKRETLNLILSMPPGTDHNCVGKAGGVFAEKNFSNNPYVHVTHNDANHPHVHLVVRMEDYDGKRLDPKKADLQKWRASFAEELRAQGIDANATPRRPRGRVIKGQHSDVVNIDKEHFSNRRSNGKPRPEMSKVTASNIANAKAEVFDNAPERINHAAVAIGENRKAIVNEYEQLHAALSKGNAEDRELAKKIKEFVPNLPSLNTRHENMVNVITNKRNQAIERKSVASSGPIQNVKSSQKVQENPKTTPKEELKQTLSKPKPRGPKIG